MGLGIGLSACGDDAVVPDPTTGAGGGQAAGGDGGQAAGGDGDGGFTDGGGGNAEGGAGGEAGTACGNDAVDAGEECDGTPDCDDMCLLITDADGDGISDLDEGQAGGVDTDGDSTPDFQDDDSDNDGIPDSIEAGDPDLNTAPIDTDGDMVPDFQDLDADGDGIPDASEVGADPLNPVDTDGDLTPDYRDTDSDNDDLSDADEANFSTNPLDPDTDADTISDGDEGTGDPDGDLIISALDDDSDGDGHLDVDEAGDADWQTVPLDTDFDGVPDFFDLDSEQDGLPDAQEADCPTLGRAARLWVDTDFDGHLDLAESLLGSDPCDPLENVFDLGVEFLFILPHMAAEQTAPLRVDPTVKQVDVHFNLDTTASMGDEILNLQGGLSTIISETASRVSFPAFGVSSFEDFPFDPYGRVSDTPWTLFQGITTSTTDITNAVNSLPLNNGSDVPEAGFESLFQIADGSGVFGTGGNFGPFTTPGRIGGAQFRPGSLPIVFHITDAPSHDAGTPSLPTCGPSWTADYPAAYNDHDEAQAMAALNNIGARVITVQALLPPNACNDEYNDTVAIQTKQIAQDTGGVVPRCAFQTGPDATDPADWRCGIDTCCDGTIPSGNQCVLRYTIANDGNGLTSAAVDGIDAIIKYTVFDVFSEAQDDGDAQTIDTSQFLARIEANIPDDTFKPPVEPERSCAPVPTPSQFNATTYNDGFSGFAVGSSNVAQEGAKLFFTVAAKNDFVPNGSVPQLFLAFIDIVDNTTSSVLDTQEVVIIVPAAPGGASE